MKAKTIEDVFKMAVNESDGNYQIFIDYKARWEQEIHRIVSEKLEWLKEFDYDHNGVNFIESISDEQKVKNEVLDQAIKLFE